MPLLSGIYDAEPIQPIAKIKENLSVYSGGIYNHYVIEFIEPMPRSSPMVVDMVTASGATVIAANGMVAKRIVAILQLAENEFFHLRFEPLDDVEGVLWEQASLGRFSGRSVHARVNLFTGARDPWLATTTFWILGMNRDMNLEVQNPNPVALPRARFVFWGYRYVLSVHKNQAVAPSPTTYVPAEGMSNRA